MISEPRVAQDCRRVRVLLALATAAVLVAVAGCGTRLEREEILTGGVSAGGGQGVGQDIAAGVVGDGAASTDGSVVDDGAGVDGAAVPGEATTGGDAVGGGADAPAGGDAGAAGGGSGAATGGGSGSAPAAGGGNGQAAQNVGNSKILGGNAPCAPAKGSPVSLGSVSTISGAVGEVFAPVVPALQTFVKSQNACGGMNGHQIKLVISDDQGDPSTARSVAQRQIEKDQVIAFIGNIQPLTIQAMVSVINEAKVPILGGDITNNSWFTNPLVFPQGSPPQSVSFAYNDITLNRYKKKKIGHIYCAEIPQSCTQIDTAVKEAAQSVGTDLVLSSRVSITAASYQSQCVQMQDAGAEVIAMTLDAASQRRFVSDCSKINYKPLIVSHPLAVGNESRFFGQPLLGGSVIPMPVFGWMANATPAEKYWQASIKRFNPGFTNGHAASLGWVSGALAVAASGKLGDSPTSAQLLDGLYGLKGNTIGGMTAPLTFVKGKAPRIPYCLFSVQANKDDTAWETPTSKATCTDYRAPSDPNK